MPRVMDIPLRSLLLILLLAGLSGCGQKGPLYRDAPVAEAGTERAGEADNQSGDRDSRAD